MADTDNEDLGIFSTFLQDNEEDTNTSDTGIFSAFLEDKKEDPQEITVSQRVEELPAPGKARIYGTGEDPEWEKWLENSELELNADTGKYEVNSLLLNNPSAKSLLPFFNLKADTLNNISALREEFLNKIEEDPLNVDKYEEEYTNKISEVYDTVLPQLQESLNASTPLLEDTRSNSEKFSNAVTQGINHFLYNEAHQGDYAKTFASSMWEKTKDILPFTDPNIKDIYLTQPYQPTDINSEGEAGIESITRSLAEIAATMTSAGGGAILGAGAGSVLPGLGTAVGSGVGATTGVVTSTGMTANAMYGETLYNEYQKYLSEGLDETEAMMRAITNATVEGGIEFGSGLLGAGIAKLAKMGVPISKVVKAAAKLAKSGGIRKTEAGYEVTKDAVKILKKDVKSIAKSAGIVIAAGGSTEGLEEVYQGSFEAIRHRKAGQSWLQAISENKRDIAKQGLWGFAGGVIGIGGARAVTRGVEVGGRKLANYLENKAVERETANAALESSILDSKENLSKEQSSKESLALPAPEEQSTVGKVSPIGNTYGTEIQGNQEVDAQGDTVLTDESTSKYNNNNATINSKSKLSSVINQLRNYSEEGSLVPNEELSLLSDNYEYVQESPNQHESSHKSVKINHSVTGNKHFNSELISDMVDVIKSTYPEINNILNEKTPDSLVKIYHAYDENLTGSNNNYSTLIGNGTFFASTKMLTNNFGKNVISTTIPAKDILSKATLEKLNKQLITIYNNESNPDLKSILAEFISGNIDESGNFTDSNINYNNLELGANNKDTKYEVRTKVLMLSRLSGKNVLAYKHTPKGEVLEYVVYNKQANHPYVYTNKSISNIHNEQNNENEPIYTEPEETGEQLKQLNTIRAEIAKANDINNTELENTIPGSVSDNGYSSSESHPVEGTGLSRKDEVPTTPETAKNNIDVHHDETIKAMDALKMAASKKSKKQSNPPYQKPIVNKAGRPVTNEDVSSIHKYYGVKNFVESVGSAVTDRAGRSYNLFIKGELSNKEKRMKKIGKNVRGYVRPMVDNVIRISNSRDYPTVLHETVHHLVAKMKLLQTELQANRALIKSEHKKLEKIDPSYKLNEAGYKKRGQDITEEYFANLVGAYGTDVFIPGSPIVDLINKAMEQVGVTEQFNTMRQQFMDYNTLHEQKDGALKIAENNMKAAALLQQGNFDTTDLTAKQLSFFKKVINYASLVPRRFIETWLNETYQIEKDARRVGKFREVLKSNQALQSYNRIANAFIVGTGVFFNNGNLHKLERSKAIKSLSQIYAETAALGKGYDNTLKSLLWAKQTIGESTGTQAKANNLLTLTKDLGYNDWVSARRDLKLLSLLYKPNLYQGTHITQDMLIKGEKELRDKYSNKYISEEDTVGKSIQADFDTINFNDPNLLIRLNAIIDYVKTKAIRHSPQLDIKNNFIRDNFILDKAGEVNTGMSLSDALRIYTSLQNDPNIAKLEGLENDVRTLLTSLEDLMSASSVSSKVQIEFAKANTGAWYIPLLRFIDIEEEKAIGINLKGDSLKHREGSNREVLDIFTSIENSIKAVANNVTQNQAIDYLLGLKDTPIFAQYMMEVPENSTEVTGSMVEAFRNKIKEIDNKIKDADDRGEKLPADELQQLNLWKNNFSTIIDAIEDGKVPSEDARLQFFINVQPTNKNIIQRLEADGRIHYYKVNNIIKDFIYNQRKSIDKAQLAGQYVKDHFNLIYKVNRVLQTIARTSYTTLRIPFQVANVPRDTLDVAIKGVGEDATFASGLFGLVPRYISQLYNYLKISVGLMKAKNREDFNTIMTLFGGAEQTQYREGDYTTTYLNYKLNKKGKIVRGGMVGWLETLNNLGGVSDLITRYAALKRRCDTLGLDIHDINAVYDDYVSLELPKKLLKRYISDSDIETIFGKDKAEAWKHTKDNEYIPFVPEDFEKTDLDNILSPYQQEIDEKVNPDLRSELQEIYDGSSIDFSKGTATTRSLGKLFLFFNTRVQGGYQYLRFGNAHKKYFCGCASALLMIGILGDLLGRDDDDDDDDENTKIKGIHIKDNDLGVDIILPTQSLPLIPVSIGRSIGKLIKNLQSYIETHDGSSQELADKLYKEKEVKDIGKDLITELTSILWDNTVGGFDTPSGLLALTLGSFTFFPTGELPSFGNEKKYHEFSYFTKKKAGINVDTLTKNMDSLLSRKLSKWLVDNGVYKYSAHEIDRYLKLYFGNAEKQLEGMFGLKAILDDKNNNLGWFDYTNDMIKALLDSLTKPFTVPIFPKNKASKEIDKMVFENLSLYDRLTGQVGTTSRNRVKPNKLSSEDRRKFQKLYDNHYLANRAQSNLRAVYSVISRIDRDASGGDKAYKEAVTIYKDVANYYLDIINSYDPFEELAEPYNKLYPLLDKEKNIAIGDINNIIKTSNKEE